MSKIVVFENNDHDSLSAVLRQLDFSATVFFRDGYCGQWAIDTSGSTQVPFHLVCQGEGWLHGAGGRPQRLLAGQLVLFPHDSAHVLADTDKPPSESVLNRPPPQRLEGAITRLVCGYFLFDQRIAAPLLSSLPSTLVLDLSQSGDPCVRELVNLWMQEAARESYGSDLAIDRFAELVFIQMLREEIEQGRLRGFIGSLGDAQLGPGLASIHREPGAPHRLSDMAQLAGLSDSAFTKRFKRSIGMTPGRYLKHWRMQIAARALADGNRSMLEIANSVGYDSEVAFRKTFKNYIGTAPGAYRRYEQRLSS